MIAHLLFANAPQRFGRGPAPTTANLATRCNHPEKPDIDVAPSKPVSVRAPQILQPTSGLYLKFLSRLRPKQVPPRFNISSVRRESQYDAKRADHVVSAKRQPNSAVSRSF